MTRRLFLVFVALVSFGRPLPAKAAGGTPRNSEGNESLQQEVCLALQRGALFLKNHQSPNGSWSNASQPAISGLALLALGQLPKETGVPAEEALEKGYEFVRSQAKSDGGIYAYGLSNYNTAICTLALLLRADPMDAQRIKSAHRFLREQQTSNMARSELNGGLGYGPTGVSPKRQHPDLDNTLVSLEALRACEMARVGEKNDVPQLDWSAAIAFVTRCQNLPETNPLPWASAQSGDRGGFVYYPGFSNAGTTELPGGGKALRSYGTMTYAGLLSFVYAEVSPQDQRVVAASEWLRNHFTLEENPGLGQEGLYYYYHLMAKALSISGANNNLESGLVPKGWARALAHKLILLQAGDGSWANSSGRWMETDATLVTAYSMLALERARKSF
ncbi:MAG: squalene-hopene/tetraprenyl-beta-curcumene cyclase [Verrucomicrobia bacterium]|nr:MAG: squalene-hopene/tetraprenyl-beta-curcumene cyclase [Verrucomicrobiota bacterium]